MERRATVLVVDDDQTDVMLLAQLLQESYEVIVANNGTQALELARAASPDVILLDVVMPHMDGYAVCRQLKSNAATAHIPVIFITSLHDGDAESRGLELGAVDYVTKPFNAAVIRARVRNHVELKQMRDVLFSLAATDGLTGLANRRRFDEALDAEFRRLGRARLPLSLILFDIDFFKAFNDTYGHIAGDDCLRAVARALASPNQRSPDLIARYGGEEFACLLPETDLPGAVGVAERIRAAIHALHIPHSGSQISEYVTASFGVAAQTCIPSGSATAVLRLADTLLYQAKAGGRNRIVSAFASGPVPD